MKIVMVAGFLGSGKTTTILDLARYLTSRQDARLAVLVNEAGDIPMDGAVLTAGGNKVKEIFAGCICCQVATSLVGAVRELDAYRDLDFLIIEPSGLADPMRVYTLLSRADQSVWRSIYIVDAPRFGLLLQAAGQIIRRGVGGADVVLVNKAELLDAAGLAQLEASVKQLNQNVAVLPVSARQGVSAELWRRVLIHEQ